MNSGVQRVYDKGKRTFCRWCHTLLTSVMLPDKCLGGINRTLSSSVAVRVRNSMASHIFLAHNVTSKIHKNNSLFASWWWWY